MKIRASESSCMIFAMWLTACTSGTSVAPSMASLPAGAVSTSPPTALAECPASPNCVGSSSGHASTSVAPFALNGQDPVTFQSRLQQAVAADGGVVQKALAGYVWATYTSSVFHFVDDIEWLLEPQAQYLDVRSASRIGYSDFGVNADRVGRLREALATP